MTWEQEYCLGEGATITHGYAFKSTMMTTDPIDAPVVVNIGNFMYDGGFRFSSTKIQRVTHEAPADYVLSPGDILLVMTCQTPGGEILGIPGRIPEDGTTYLHNQRMGKLVINDADALDAGFLYYLFLSAPFNRHLYATSTGAKILHTAPKRIEAFRFDRPPLPTQRRIAGILSAYDDLIENNTKRIKILEEMARALFFSFKGLGSASSTTRSLGELSDAAGGTIRTGPFGSSLHQSDYTEAGTPVVMPKDIKNGRISEATIARVPAEIVERLSQHVLHKGDIVYGRRGDIGRRGYIGDRESGWLCGTGCLRISLPDGALSPRYLHEYLGQEDVIAQIAGRAVGSTMPNLNTKILRSIPIEVPPREIQTQFDEAVASADGLRDNLIAQLQNLRETRELLLPRLISGEIDVNSLDLPEAAQ